MEDLALGGERFGAGMMVVVGEGRREHGKQGNRLSQGGVGQDLIYMSSYLHALCLIHLIYFKLL